MTPDLPALVAPVREIARQAAREILTFYRQSYRISDKADATPVTEADLAAHHRILAGLSRLTPAIPILSEESAHIPFQERQTWEWLWLVDPLDGTRQFIRHNDEFSINIALIHRHRAVLGLILMPVGELSYFAWQRGGAWRQACGQSPQPIQTRSVGRRAVQVVGSRTYRSRFLEDYLTRLGQHVYSGVGSALKSCLVAEGRADLYPRFGPTSEWDTAAAQILLEEAGGGLTDLTLKPLKYNARPTLLNPDFFAFGDPTRDWHRYLHRPNNT
ncbi:MAG: 3'(2'),5'-bisphosphate nucleotidase CysQ [Candidatus Competibacteraceae bacterium]|nr:3'(2'),5'-bisphosphate nucleotidase CysQ [Candidatus Competibacteraceae bacterium]